MRNMSPNRAMLAASLLSLSHQRNPDIIEEETTSVKEASSRNVEKQTCSRSTLIRTTTNIIANIFDHVASVENIEHLLTGNYVFTPVPSGTNVAGRTVVSNTMTKACSDLAGVMNAFFITNQADKIKVDLIQLFKGSPRFKQLLIKQAVNEIIESDKLYIRSTHRKHVFTIMRSIVVQLKPDAF